MSADISIDEMEELDDGTMTAIMTPPRDMNTQRSERGDAAESPEIDPGRLEEFLGSAVQDMGAAMSAALVALGDRLGLYRAMADSQPVTAAELARRTGTRERYVREWLNNQAAGGYVRYDPAVGTYTLPPEQAFALANENSPAFLPGAFQIIMAASKAVPRIEERFRTGEGLDWCDHDPGLFEGTERFFRPGYAAHLITDWIPSLDGVEEQLRRGTIVADIGCGHGASTILMAQAYPNSTFRGFDFHPASIETAARKAKAAGVGDRVTFEVARSTAYPGKGYGFACCFDSLHDMGDPTGAARHVLESLAPDGTWMIVEPFAGDRIEENLNPVGRVFYAASTLICVPASLAQEGAAFGAQAGEAKLREAVTAGGFSRFRRATQTPFNLVFEARP